MRPVMINGIDDLAVRADLLDRSINLTLEQIADENRQDEGYLWEGFYKAQPLILGGLLDAVSAGQRNLCGVDLTQKPRMADFAMFSVAAAPQLGWSGDDFLDAYNNNRNSANDLAIESSPVGPAIQEMMENRDSWEGIAKELLLDLEEHHVDEKTQHRKDWPKSPQAMKNALRRIAPNLRKSNINVIFNEPQGNEKRRIIQLEKVGEPCAASAALSAIGPGDPGIGIPCGSSAAQSGTPASHSQSQQPAANGIKNGDSDSETGLADHAVHAVHEIHTQSNRQRVEL